MSKPILAFDLGGSAIKYALFNNDGVIVNSGSVVNPSNTDFTKYSEAIDLIIRSQGIIGGLAFSTPGGFSDGVIKGSTNLPCIHNFPIKEYFENKYQVKSSFINDGSAGCLGEYFCGVGKGCSSVVALVIGSGIGGGLVLNDELILGKDGFGGEFGHSLYKADYQNNIFESFHKYASVGGLITRYCEINNLSLDFTMGKKIFDLAKSGDEIATKLVDEFYDALALLILTVNYTCDPDMVIVSGPVTKRNDFLDNLLKRINQIEDNKKTNIIVNLALALNPEEANLYGAWRYFISCFMEANNTYYEVHKI